MKKNILILTGIFVSLICSSQQTDSNKNTDKKEWQLVWQDEFNGNEVNVDKWNIDYVRVYQRK
ncbi:MAG: hypothetical protein LBK94_03380 [Prevotellaceae bacterium]|jgi:hypothetical protein|nr:hypothetical protein [Prevotellaceae bacterium]